MKCPPVCRCLPPNRACPSPAAVGIDDGQGVLVRSVMEHGLARKLREHPVWGDLLAGAQLCVGGEAARPLGVQAAGGAPHAVEAAEELAAATA